MLEMMMTDEEIRESYRRARNQSEQVYVLAQLNDCPPNKIREIVGLPVGKKSEHIGIIAKVLMLTKAGKSVTQIAGACRTTPTNVYSYQSLLRKQGKLPPLQSSKGARLSPERRAQVEQIVREMTKAGATRPEIAARAEVSLTTVSDYQKRLALKTNGKGKRK